jgi:hypothetical protein
MNRQGEVPPSHGGSSLRRPPLLFFSFLALVISILSYTNSTALRFDVSVGMPWTETAVLREIDTDVPAYIVYGDRVGREFGLSRVAVAVEVRITNLGARPFSVAQLSAHVKLELPENIDLSVTSDSLPPTFDKVYDELSDSSNRKVQAPFLLEPGAQRSITLRFELPLIDRMTERIFQGKKLVSTKLFCERFQAQSSKFFGGNERILGEFLDAEVFVQVAQSDDPQQRRIHLCNVDVVRP